MIHAEFALEDINCGPIVLAQADFHVREGSGSDEAVIREMWDENVYQMPYSAIEGAVVDIGANIGSVSVWAAKMGATVYAVEPERHNRALLRENVAANDVEVSVLGLAVGREGTALITNDHGGSRLVDYPQPGTAHYVPVITLDTLLRNTGIEEVAICKIDTEGSEYDIVEYASLDALNRIAYLVMEFHTAPAGKFGAMIEKLAEVFNIHIIGSPARGGQFYGRRY